MHFFLPLTGQGKPGKQNKRQNIQNHGISVLKTTDVNNFPKAPAYKP